MEKLHISYNQIHQAICDCVNTKQVYETFQPTLIIAIGSGGFIPARMLRTFLKAKCGKSLPIQTIGLILYDDNLDKYDPETAVVRKTQWLNYGAGEGTGISLQGHNVLIVDEVDDTRKTLSYAVSELSKDIEKQRQEYEARRKDGDSDWRAPRLGVFVVHNKLKQKSGILPEEVMEASYFKCQDVPDNWIVYPWDALDIAAHQRAADERTAAAAVAVADAGPGASAAPMEAEAEAEAATTGPMAKDGTCRIFR
ncbi:hypothetical protein VOLCADRAFT_61062 [Volvox carteri f. nagariensis]|uniref:Phosphoribosyltransferase domain-containing protein n=1 Tax=Volvox carteri f. nagariensis TaxID=3068 RepID=D8TX72_VOLCA|nr:uncharacterized protein VOLCADRAFT_61062 [Volvox carteri f. nagariensis]EFJ47960.1 hypothetical protein VOLCADRAFT_61062 [Volvox carteri f. nagariensis]|eukprot:XP_002951066.1 hypothetical protein VOLCADRAFT_61062 [Volvox carteri f. nagariensis]